LALDVFVWQLYRWNSGAVRVSSRCVIAVWPVYLAFVIKPQWEWLLAQKAIMLHFLPLTSGILSDVVTYLSSFSAP